VLEDAVDWLVDQTQSMPKPFLGYFHLYPPHDPYKTRREYVDVFKGTHAFPDKPVHLLSTEGLNQGQMKLRRQLYDESILYVDAEFNRLYSELESNGILENTYLVLTADHGELFERGLSGHFHRLLYQGVTHIPLVIFPPGHQERVDITIPTSAVDVLPTLLHLTGHTVPEWAEGFVLPPFGPAQPTERPLFTIEAKDNRQFQPLTQGTISMVTWPYKLIFYMGYKELGEMSATYELYNLANDPDELVDLYNAEDERSQRLANALQAKLDAVNIPYR
jgi:arylsulfatase A-like enzyme